MVTILPNMVSGLLQLQREGLNMRDKDQELFHRLWLITLFSQKLYPKDSSVLTTLCKHMKYEMAPQGNHIHLYIIL